MTESPGEGVPGLPTSECYWVTDRILAGKYPGALLEHEAVQKVESLVSAGVRTFIDLTEREELLPYSQLLPSNVRHERIAVPDVTSPRENQIERALAVLDEAVTDGIVYVHCRGGCGRTGVILGCYLVAKGASPDAALDRVRELTRALWHSPCPETSDQIAMVRHWASRH